MNNRQNGRRRGRGGQQVRNGQPGAPDRGSRVDNRARGNAAQLLEKYKTLARDAQMQGDRVNTEYYLQFADHYFRVLSENRSRFEEQRPRQRDEFGNEQDDGGDGGQRGYQERAFQDRDDGQGEDGWDDGDTGNRAEQPPEPRRAPEQRRQERPVYQGGASAAGNEGNNGDRPRGRRPHNPPATEPAVNGGESSGNGFAGSPDSSTAKGAPARIEVDRMPPSLSAAPPSASGEGDEAETPKPRRRARRPRTDAAPVAEA